MANIFLSKYLSASHSEKTNASNLLLVLSLMVVSAGLLFVSALLRPGVSSTLLPYGLMVHLAVCLTALLFLTLGKQKMARWLGYGSLLVILTFAALASRTGVIEMDMFRTTTYYFLGLMILSLIGVGSILAGVWIGVGVTVLVILWRFPVEGFLSHTTIAQWNETMTPLTPLVIYLTGALSTIFQVVQSHRTMKLMQFDQEIIETTNQMLEETVVDRTQALRTILDSSGQGLFTFGSDFQVQPDYSQGCRVIFGEEIEGKEVDHLLFPNAKDMAEEFRQGLTLFFRGKSKASVIFDLLEKETFLKGRFITIGYREAGPGKILCVLTDVTVDRQLSDRTRADESTRTLVLRALGNKHFFAGLLSDAEELFTSLRGYEERAATKEEAQTLLAAIHTFKGNCGFFGFSVTQEVAHDFEYAISDAQVLGEELDYRDLSLDLKKAYYQELNIITEALGKGWLAEAGGIVIPRPVYDKVAKYISRKFSDETHLVDVLEHFRKMPLKDLFSRFPFVAQATAEKLGKKIAPMQVQVVGGDLRVVPDRLDGLVSACVHIVNNMVDHGIELSYVREANGKPPEGRLALKIVREARSVVFQFMDDGQGVSLADVEARAKSLGLIEADAQPAPRELLQVLFKSGFSTRDEATEVSGRGIGLAAVRVEAEKLGGRVEVQSKPNAGTTFEIILPIGVFANRRSRGPSPGPERRKR